MQQIDGNTLTLSEFRDLFHSGETLEISEEAKQEVQRSRAFLEEKIRNSPHPIYGINTGFGKLCREEIEEKDLEQLQINLVFSHACGVGDPVPAHISKLMMLLKIKSFLTGHSAVTPELLDRLVAFYNSGAAPLVFEKGSLGASGDLVPLAHMTLPLLGEGEVYWKGNRISGADFLKEMGWAPITLKAKEGLAMLNGTQFMLAMGLEAWWRAETLLENSFSVFALSMDAFDSRTDFLYEPIHQLRRQKGQMEAASRLRLLLQGSGLAEREKAQVQDPYSLRCLPQVIGASMDAIRYTGGILENELNAITDNPLVFRKEDLVVSGGNFHGQPLALALDFLAIAVAEIANIAERLLYQLLTGERGLPIFLTQNPGLESGFMIPQYAAAALVSQNKQLSTPASVDSIVSSNGQEDHVSMGANAALKAVKVVENAESVLGILLLAGAQALEYRRPMQSSHVLEKMVSELRKTVSFRNSDRLFKPDMDAATAFFRTYSQSD
jgi:histidine ammonia-lyase